MPYVFVVRHLKDGRNFVAKVNGNPREKHILQLLDNTRPRSKHIITFLGSFPSTIGEAILLPKCNSVREPGGNQWGYLQFSKDLVEGLAFVHHHKIAHRDIKPDNLVYSDTSGLQIIDFDVAMKVRDVNQTVDDDVGTEGFRAPETKARNGRITPYSPIKADRWSCGRTIQLFAECAKESDHRRTLRALATKLVNEDPGCRKSLQESCGTKGGEMDRTKTVEWDSKPHRFDGQDPTNKRESHR